MRFLIVIIFLCLSSWNSVFAQEKGDLRIEIKELRNLKGKLSIVIFNSPEGFPEEDNKAYKWQILDLEKSAPLFLFKDLPVGEYAYAILHDEDKDGKMKKNLIGIPKEGFGFSNNYRPRVKNPSFEDASFQLKPGENRHELEMVYYL
jgi:uncharacterized protein (DUF2141 family)